MGRIFWIFLAVLFGAVAFVAIGSEGDGEDLDAVHHVADGNYLDFEPFGKVELPRILLVRRADGSLGLDVFLTTHSAVASEGYVVVSEEAAEAPAADAHDLEEQHQGAEEDHGGEHAGGVLAPVSGELLVDLSITRHLVFIWLGALIVFLIFRSLARRYERGIGRETAPRGVFHNMFESLVIFVRDEIARPNLGDKTDRFLPYLLTAFTLIYACNLLGLVPFGSTATSNISVTAVLAAFTFVITQVSANKDHWKHLFGPPGTPLLVRFILFPVEFLGLFTKPFALAVRLFANMTAGHLVILSLIGLIFLFAKLFGPVAGYGISVVSVIFVFGIFLLELLVATIQAYIFTMLSALFIGMAVVEHDHHHDDEHGAAELPEAHVDSLELTVTPEPAMAT
ncbi:MAG: F0F1 ATP synthase subunit A [Rhodothermales bacterium]|nr:F0F1 ATP synthase subunit A [Rhodothermales bacterium]